MQDRNKDIRIAIKIEGFTNSQLASHLGISESTWYRWLRSPLTSSQKEAISKAIKELKKEKCSEIVQFLKQNAGELL